MARKPRSKYAKKKGLPRRRYKKRIPRYRSLSVPFPPMFPAKLKYSNYITLTQSMVGESNSLKFNINNLHTPESYAGAHQPYYFDQLCSATMYSYGVVYGCLVKCVCTPTAPCDLILRASTTTASPTNATLEDERPNSYSRMSTNGTAPVTLKRYFSIHKVFGVSKSKINDEDGFRCSYIGGPANAVYAHLNIYNPNTSNTTSAYVNLEMTFYCKFYDRRPVAQS